MTYRTEETAESVTLHPASSASAAVIWLHGLGADGYDFVPIVNELRLPADMAVRFVFPHARARPVTINNGFVMRAWYDIMGLAASSREDEAGIRESEQVVRRYVDEQVARGIDSHRIVVAGFSQGGAMALQSALRYPQRLAAVMALSAYLPLRQSLAAEASGANRGLPILMCHGLNDGIVPAALGTASRDLLQSLGYEIEWHSYAMEHQVCMEEIAHISTWLQVRLARNI